MGIIYGDINQENLEKGSDFFIFLVKSVGEEMYLNFKMQDGQHTIGNWKFCAGTL